MQDYMNPSLSPEERARLLLQKMTVDEKIFQLSSQLIWDSNSMKRDYRVGSMRNPGHFANRFIFFSPLETAEIINEDTKRSIEANRFGIPVLQNGEALHGAQWVSATVFPQALGLAAMFDEKEVEKVATVVGKEVRAGGVRHVFAPVINVTRDPRWGRTEEAYGEDVTVTSRCGVAYCRGLEKNGVISTPKHFVDNFGEGGRDSAYSIVSERTLREVYLEPFRACFQEGGAHSVMAAYNSVDGVSCSCNETLLNDILRKEWGFDGIVVSDYGGVEGVCNLHAQARDEVEAMAMCLKAGLDIKLPRGGETLRQAYDRGLITEEDLDRSVLRVLKQKFRLGLFENPYVDPEEAQKIVRCNEHRALALDAADKTMVLLKNNGILPLKKETVRRIGVYGPSMDTLNFGGYTGPVGGWNGNAKTPIQALKDYLGESCELVVCTDMDQFENTAKTCDINLFFAAVIEGEGSDRSDLRLAGTTKSVNVSDENAIIIGTKEKEIKIEQEQMILTLSGLDIPLAVILTGGPVEASAWADKADAILEAWYPGERGSEAIVRTLFGENNPGGKLPITFPRSTGTEPCYHAMKPLGRPPKYIEIPITPLFPFGYGLSYTTFSLSDFSVLKAGKDGFEVEFTICNTGDRDGSEVVQLYLGRRNACVVLSGSELKDYKRIYLKAGESRKETLSLTVRDLSFYDRKLNFGIFPCTCKAMVGTSSDDVQFEHIFEID